MDPLSITASAIACGGAAKSATKALRKIRKYAHAKEDIDAMVKDIEDVQALLQTCSELVANGDFNTSKKQYLHQQVSRLGERIDDLSRILVPPHHHIPGVSEERQLHLSWVKHESRIKSLRADLVEAKSNVTSALTVITTSSTIGIGRSLSTSLDLQHQQHARLVSVIEKVNSIEMAFRGFRGLKDSQSAASDQDDRSSNRASQVITYTDTGQDSSEPSLSDSLELVSTANDMLPAAKSKPHWPHTGLPKCANWCSCRCHSKTMMVVPRFLRSVVGKTVVQYAGNQAPCNEHSCRRSSKPGLELSYCVPRYLSRQYILVRMSRAPLGNPTVNIRMPRTMDWTHLLWKYAPKGDLKAVQSLIESAKAAPDDTNFQGGTALLLASAHPELYQYLIRAGADLNVADMHGRKPVNLIGERYLTGRLAGKDAEATKELLADTDFMESRQFNTIHKSVLRLSERVLAEELHESTASLNAVDAEGRTPLHWATMRNDLTTVDTLLGFKADPNVRDYAGNTPLHYVRDTDPCSALIHAGADIHAKNRTRRRTCVHHICKSTDNPELINLLHERGADIDLRDVDSETPLCHAVSCNFTKTAKQLIDLGADVNAANNSSRDSVIHFAVAFDHCEIIPHLLERGVDYTATNRHGKTIAHKAAAWGTRYTVDQLAKLNLADLDLSVRDVDGKTARDHMSERDVLLESEAGIHVSFKQFAITVEDAKAKTKQDSERQDPGVGISRRGTETIRPPGSFPAQG